MELRAPYISVVDPIGPAIERAKTILFRPFDLGRWFVIGFCAWLAQLGSGPRGGSSNRFQYRVDQRDIRHEFYQTKDYVLNNLEWIIPVGIGILAIVIAVWLIVLWLSSRGRFMFLYCVAQNKAEVTNPWHRFRGHANSLFAFRAVVGIITMVAAILPFVLGGIVVSASTVTLGFNPLTIIGIVMAVTFFIAVLIVSGVITVFTTDFVVPIMYLHATGAVASWRILLDLMSVNRARFFLYVLILIAVSIAIGTMVLIAACCTCGCACCLFALPYIGTVALLPVFVFRRSYSLYYLAQYGPELNVFSPSPQASPPESETVG